MKKLALLTLCAGLLCSCTIYEMPSSSSSKADVSSSSSATKVCLYPDSREHGCTVPTKDTCPGDGILVDTCPYSSSSSN